MLLSVWLTAQKINIAGYVQDNNTGERLIGASVFSAAQKKGSITNSYGYFNYLQEKGEALTLNISYVGYLPQEIIFDNQHDTLISINLVPDLRIEEITVYGDNQHRPERELEMSVARIGVEDIRNLPSIAGEPDVLKAFQLMPGVQGGQEGTNGLYVRGGTPDQNLFLLDDVPLYNVNHVGGFVSVFDISMLKSIDLYKGGFPARYNGRVSSIMDIRLKDGNMKELHGEIGTGILLTKLMLEGPVKKDKSSFAFSVRRCNFDLLAYVQQSLFPDPAAPNDRWGFTFHDLNFKWNWIVSENDRFHLSAYFGNDITRFQTKETTDPSGEYDYSSKDLIKWGNRMFSARWNHVYGKRLFHNITLASTQYKYSNSFNYKKEGRRKTTVSSRENYLFYSSVKDYILKADFECHMRKQTIRTGINATCHNYTPAFTSYSSKYSDPVFGDTILGIPEKKTILFAAEGVVYAEYEVAYLDKVKANVGINASVFNVEGAGYLSVQPRLVFNYRFVERASLKASYSRMQQNAHLLSNSGVGLPSDLWVPSTARIKPEYSDQVALGLAHTPKKGLELSVEAYYKKMYNLIDYKAGTIIFNDAEQFTDKLEVGGKGVSKGVEILLRKNLGALNGWLGYTLSKTNRNFEAVNGGKTFPFKYDRRHEVSLVANWQIRKNITLTATWVYSTGHALTLPKAKYQLRTIGSGVLGNGDNDSYVNADIHVYGGKNSFRMPAYHRLDAGAAFSKQKKKGMRKWTVGIYNIYNQQNAYFVYFKRAPGKIVEENGVLVATEAGQTKLYQITLMPIFPYLSYSFLF